MYVVNTGVRKEDFDFMDVLSGKVSPQEMERAGKPCSKTTVEANKEFSDRVKKIFIDSLRSFNTTFDALIKADKRTLYSSFKIPKKSGGLRQIDAPNENLSAALRILKSLFESSFGEIYHDCAYAYVKGRCTVDAVKVHQANNSHWFAKFDFSNFFGSTTLDFVMSMMSEIYPFCYIVNDDESKEVMKTALSLAFLDGGLPQGTPISPFITNMMMIPIDYKLSTILREQKPYLIYTRYADDLLISGREGFDVKNVESLVDEVLKSFNAPFKIKPEKTHYCSRAGKNWNLGVMLNKDNNITIGHRNKKIFKAMLCNFSLDYKNGKLWEPDDLMVLNGKISYYLSVEKFAIQDIIDKYSDKYGLNIVRTIRAQINDSVA